MEDEKLLNYIHGRQELYKKLFINKDYDMTDFSSSNQYYNDLQRFNVLNEMLSNLGLDKLKEI